MNPDEELFDIFDDHFQPAGTATRRQVHAQGLWHRTFQCWILNVQDGVPTLLFQKRHPQKDTYPGLLDISCAGHLVAGEQVEDGGRELYEELGISPAFADLLYCGVYYSDNKPAEGLIDREICHIYLYRSDLPLDAYRLQPEELIGLFRITVQDVKRLAYQGEKGGNVQAVGVELAVDGTLQWEERTFVDADFVPRAAAYYELLLTRMGIILERSSS